MFLRRIYDFLVGELLKSPDYAEPRVSRLDHVVDVAVACRIVWVAEEVVVFLFLRLCHLCLFCRVFDCLDFLRVEDFNRTVCTHDGNVCRRPSIIDVAPELFAAHHDVGAAV